MEGEGERDLKALPYVIAWFGRVEEAVAEDDDRENYNVNQRKHCLYQFAKTMPTLTVHVSHMAKGMIKNERGCDIDLAIFGG